MRGLRMLGPVTSRLASEGASAPVVSMERNSGDWHKLSELKAGARVIGGMVVKSARIKRLYQNIARLGPYKATILIQGESGTGKELAAQALHRLGPNPNGP